MWENVSKWRVFRKWFLGTKEGEVLHRGNKPCFAEASRVAKAMQDKMQDRVARGGQRDFGGDFTTKYVARRSCNQNNKRFKRKDAENAEYRKEKPLRDFANSAT